MSTKNKTIWSIVVLVVVVVMVSYALKSNTPAQAQVIKVGAILPLTGDSASLGESGKNALELAMADLKGTKYQYQIIYEDIGNFDSSLTASAMNKLANIDNVNAVITLSSGTGNVIAPIANNDKVIQFSCASDLHIAQGEYNFLDVTPPSEETKLLVAELEKKGYKRLGLFYTNQQGMLAMMDETRKQIQGTDIQIVADQKVDPGTTDFRSMILMAQQAKPDIYILNLLSPGLENLAKQMKELKITTPVTAVEAFEYTDQMNLFEGDWYVQQADALPWFTAEYQSEYGKVYKVCAPNFYDSFNLLAAAYEKAGQNASQDNVVNQLLQIQNYNGALGTVSIGADHIAASKAALRMIKDGQPVTIGK